MAETAHSTPAPTVRLPHAFTPEQEREHLLRIVRPTLDRIGALNRLIEQPAALPHSGMRLVGATGNSLLFRGGRDA